MVRARYDPSMRRVLAPIALLALLCCGGDDTRAQDAGPPSPCPGPCHGDNVIREDCRSLAPTVSACIDKGGSPRACRDEVKGIGCDYDQDGLDDLLEAAMLRSYAPVFAFNKGDGDHTAGDSEPHYPTNIANYVEHSTLYWRVDGDEKTKKVVLEKPMLATFARWSFSSGWSVTANDPKLGAGPNFWLCLNKEGGVYPEEALVGSMEASRKLAGGVDLLGGAHFTSNTANTNFVVLDYMLYYAYNKFSLDDHEGDFEGGAVFVSLDTGKVVAVYTDRHPTSDGVKLIPIDGDSALPIKDPTDESPKYNVCDDTGAGSESAGVRFWDFATTKHHPVIYVAAGGHASYSYPGATKIKGLGCTEATMVRDVHNGNGPKLVPHENAYYTDWKDEKHPIETGVNVRNMGVRRFPGEPWMEFAGQWGCTFEAIPKSYPGPWDNERLCRHWLTNDWGPLPPFSYRAANAAGCSGL